MLAVCCWALRVFGLSWRATVQIKQAGCPTALLSGLQRCSHSREVALQALPALVLAFDKQNLDEYRGAYALGVCSDVLKVHTKDAEVAARCLGLLDLLAAEKGFPAEALESRFLVKRVVATVRNHPSADSVAQVGLVCAARCARCSPQEFLEKAGGKKAVKKALRAVRKAGSEAAQKAANELAAVLGTEL